MRPGLPRRGAGAVAQRQAGRIYHRDRCVTCGECVETCYAEGLQLIGKEMTLGEVVPKCCATGLFTPDLRRRGDSLRWRADAPDRISPWHSWHGCKAEGHPYRLETTTHCRWEHLEAALPLTDLFMVDIKHIDPEKHQAATGVSNEQILANIRRLAGPASRSSSAPRSCPGVNDTPAEIAPSPLCARPGQHARRMAAAGLSPGAAALPPPGSG